MILRSVVLLAIVSCCVSPASAQDKTTYDDHIKPIFRAKCFGCHNLDKKAGDLDLTNYTALMQGGASGAVVEAGDSESSYLWSLVSHTSTPTMPPKQEKMAAPVLATIKKWIDGGALESKSSTAKAGKPKVDLTLKGVPTGKPDGPAAMPNGLPLVPVIRTARTTALTAIATSPWAPLVAVAGQKQIVLYDASTLKLAGILPFPEGIPYVLKFSRNGELLLAAGGRGAYRGLVVVWNVRTGERVFQVGDEVDCILAADISSDQSLIALGTTTKMVRVYSTATGELLHSIKKHNDWVYTVEFSPDGVLLATGDRGNGMFVWEAHTGRLYLTLAGHSSAINAVSWRGDSNILASCSRDGSIRLWEMENGRTVKSWGAHGGGVASVEFTRDGRLVSCGRDKVTKLWDQNGAQQRAFEAFTDLALQVTHCDETNRVIAGDWNGEIRVWNAADGKRIGLLTANPEGAAELLKKAQSTLTTRKAAYDKLAVTAQAAINALAKINADIANAQKVVVTSQAQVKTATDAGNTYKANITKLTGEAAAATKSATEIAVIVAALKDADEKVQAAAAKLATDKELAAAAAQVKAKHAAQAKALTDTQKLATDKLAAAEAAKKQLATSDAQLKAAQTALAAAQKQVTDLTPTVKPAEAAVTAAKTALNAAGTLLNESEKEVAGLQAQITLQEKQKVLTDKQAALATTTAALQTATATAAKIKADIAAANTLAVEGQKQLTAATTAIATYKAAVTKATTEQATAAATVTGEQSIVVLLNGSLAKAVEASKKVPADKDLAAAVAQLTATIAKKQAALDAAKKVATEKTATVAAANAQLANGEKVVVEKTAVVAAAKKKAADLAPLVKPADDKVVAAKKVNDAAAAAAEAAKKEVDALRAKLAPPKVETAKAG